MSTRAGTAATSPTAGRSGGSAPRGRPITILTSDLGDGAFANLCPALAAGIAGAGGGPVDLLYLSAGPAAAVALPPGVRLVELDSHRAAAIPVALVRYLRRERPRLLVTMPSFVTLPALLGYRLAGRRVRRATRFVVYQGDTLRSDIAIDHWRFSRLRIMPVLANRWFRWADGLTATAPGVLALLREDGVRLPPGPVRVIANPVDVDACRAAAADTPTHPWIVDRTGPVVTTLSRLVKRKNHAMMLRALAEVRRSGIDARLVVFGRGPELAPMQAEAQRLGLTQAVDFAGFTANPFTTIARSDLFVMSSIDEAFCLALVEAMACGVPVLSTDAVGGGPRFVLTGTDDQPASAPADAALLRAALLPRDDDDALSAAMANVLSDADLAGRLGAAGRRRAEDFSPASIGRQWLAFVESLG